MSLGLIRRLQRVHAFDPSPIRYDLGAYHVPFEELVPGTSSEGRLAGAARRGERIAIVGRSGSGKSSLIEHVLGPTVPGVAPIPIPVFGEPVATVTSVAAVAGLIIQTLVDHHTDLNEAERVKALRSASTRRFVQPTTRTTGLTLGGAWMGASVQAEVRRQVPPNIELPRTAQATLEVVHQLLTTIQNDELMPVLVFDDTDRWFRNVGSSFSHQQLALAFFGTVLTELRQLPAGMVVAAHTNYLEDTELADHLRAVIELRVNIPELTSAGALGKVIHSRVIAHTSDDSTTPPLGDVLSSTAVDRLHELYRNETLGSLRDVIRAVHVAVTDACNGGFDIVTPEAHRPGVSLVTGPRLA